MSRAREASMATTGPTVMTLWIEKPGRPSEEMVFLKVFLYWPSAARPRKRPALRLPSSVTLPLLKPPPRSEKPSSPAMWALPVIPQSTQYRSTEPEAAPLLEVLEPW